MDFLAELREWSSLLRKRGYRVSTPHLVNHRKSHLSASDIHKLKRRESRKHFKKIAQSSAILVTNYDKNGTKGYIGGAAFGEIAVAFSLGKKVFLVNDIPEGMPYTEELKAWGVRVWKGPFPELK
jgi:hypothetical protein